VRLSRSGGAYTLAPALRWRNHRPVARRQLLVYGFGSHAAFEGRLVGALERLGSGGTLRVTDVLFLHCDAETGERSAIGLRGTDAGRFVAPLLDFRLDRGGGG
jgi:hypothetical protein